MVMAGYFYYYYTYPYTSRTLCKLNKRSVFFFQKNMHCSFRTTLHTSGEEKLNPNYVTGLSDGEGSFIIGMSKNESLKNKWQVQPVFAIKLHVKDIALLYRIKSFFGCGTVVKVNNNGITTVATYSVKSVADLTNKIIPHFDKYPLLTQKRADFELFKKVRRSALMSEKTHLEMEGLCKIVSIKASMNNGLSDEFKTAFLSSVHTSALLRSEGEKEIIPVLRPIVKHSETIDPYWLSGFVEAESCFFVASLPPFGGGDVLGHPCAPLKVYQGRAPGFNYYLK